MTPFDILIKQHANRLRSNRKTIDVASRFCSNCSSTKTKIKKTALGTEYPHWYKHPNDNTKHLCTKCYMKWYKGSGIE